MGRELSAEEAAGVMLWAWDAAPDYSDLPAGEMFYDGFSEDGEVNAAGRALIAKARAAGLVPPPEDAPTPKKRPTVAPFWWVVKGGEGYLSNDGGMVPEQQLARTFVSRRKAKRYLCTEDERVVRVKARAR